MLALMLVGGCETGPGPTETPRGSGTTSFAPSSDPTPLLTAVAAPTPMPTASPAIGLSWREVADLGVLDPVAPEFGAFVDAAAWLNDRWIAVGGDHKGPATWWSVDGVRWAKAAIDDRLGPMPRTRGLVVGHGLAVAVGTTNETHRGVVSATLAGWRPGQQNQRPRAMPNPCGTILTADAAVMTSADGLTWTTVPSSPAFEGMPMLAVTATAAGFAAAGGLPDEPLGTGTSAAWVSDDGRSWTRAPDSGALRTGIVGALATFGGRLLGTGAVDCDGEIGALWTSIDGTTWQVDRDVPGRDIAATAAQVIVLTSEGDARTSSDGLEWRSHAMPDPYAWLVSMPDGFLAIRNDSPGISATRTGEAWEFVELDGGCWILAVGPEASLCIEEDISIGPPNLAGLGPP